MPNLDFRLRASHALGILLVIGLGTLALWQGITWDEPWLRQRAFSLLRMQPLDRFKPLAGLVFLPAFLGGGGYLAGRILYLGYQVLLGWGLFKMAPAAWNREAKLGALVWLWLEPTFRERVLEIRTDTPILLILVACTLLWNRRRTVNGLLAIVAMVVLGILISPKLLFFGLPWSIGAICSTPNGQRNEMFRLMGKIMLGAFGCAALMVALLAWIQGQSVMGFCRGVILNSAGPLRGGNGIIPQVVRIYLPQVIWQGLPFWVTAVIGLFARIRGFGERDPVWLHWEILGWVGLGLTLFYPSAFPYHFICIIPGLLPSAYRGLQKVAGYSRVVSRWSIALTILWGGMALYPLLKGPSRASQERIMNFAGKFLEGERGYVDGVGWLDQPQSADFVTAGVIAAGAADGLWRRWEREHVGVMILNGRTNLLFNPANADWARTHFTLIHPEIAVAGVEVGPSELPMSAAWVPPVDGLYRFEATPEWEWQLGGSSLKAGKGTQLKSGEKVLLTGKGKGVGRCSFHLMPREWADEMPPPVNPFFLPFQRPFFPWS